MELAYVSIVEAPEVVTDSAPHSIKLYLHTTFAVSSSTHQPDSELDVCGIWGWADINTQK